MGGLEPISLKNPPRKNGLIMMGEWGCGIITRSHKEWVTTWNRHKAWLKSDEVKVFEQKPDTLETMSGEGASDEVWAGKGPFGKNLFLIEAVFPEAGRKKFIIMVPRPSMKTNFEVKGKNTNRRHLVNGKTRFVAHHFKPFDVLVSGSVP